MGFDRGAECQAAAALRGRPRGAGRLRALRSEAAGRAVARADPPAGTCPGHRGHGEGVRVRRFPSCAPVFGLCVPSVSESLLEMRTVPSIRGGRHGLVRFPSWILVIDELEKFFKSSRLGGWEPARDGGGEEVRGGRPRASASSSRWGPRRPGPARAGSAPSPARGPRSVPGPSSSLLLLYQAVVFFRCSASKGHCSGPGRGAGP